MSIGERDAIRELLIAHLISQGFYRPAAEAKVDTIGSALLATDVNDVLTTETTLDH